MNILVIIVTVLIGGAVVGFASGITINLDNRTTRELVCCAGIVPVVFISNGIFAARVADIGSLIACVVAQGIAAAVLCYVCVFVLDRIKNQKNEDKKSDSKKKDTARVVEAVIRVVLYYGVFQAVMLTRM